MKMAHVRLLRRRPAAARRAIAAVTLTAVTTLSTAAVSFASDAPAKPTAAVAAPGSAPAKPASVAAAPTSAAATPNLDADHARLAALCGTWDVELTFWFKPGTAGVTSKGTSTIRPLLNGLFVEERIEGTLAGTPFTTLAWTGFNSDSHQYEATRIASTNTMRIAEAGVWDEAKHEFELKADYPMAGSTWHQRTVIQPESADTMTASSFLSFGQVPEWKGVEIKYTRHAG